MRQNQGNGRNGEGAPRHRRRGSVTLETVLALPVILSLILVMVQLAHLWMGKMALNYAAYCAARAALVTVCGSAGPSAANDSWATPAELEQAGHAFSRRHPTMEAELWGNRAAQQVMDLFAPNLSAERKIKVTIQEEPNRNVGAVVEYDMALVVPVAGPMIAWGMNPWGADPWGVDANLVAREKVSGEHYRVQDGTEYPYFRLSSEVWMPKPYVTLFSAQNWGGYPP